MEQPIKTNEEKRLESVNRRLALRSATALTAVLLHHERNACTGQAKMILKELYKFNLKLLTK